jgi:hypothetical protein
MIAEKDAADALAAVAQVRRRSFELRGYAHAGDLVLAWGLVWLVCNLAVQFAPDWGPNTWPVGIVLASLFCIVRSRARPRTPEAIDARVYASVSTAIAFVALVVVIAGLDDPRQTNAIISLYIAASYVGLGIWTGMRFTWAGLAIAALVLIGWFADREHFYLWMGLGGGGALIATGLWLRRA